VSIKIILRYCPFKDFFKESNFHATNSQPEKLNKYLPPYLLVPDFLPEPAGAAQPGCACAQTLPRTKTTEAHAAHSFHAHMQAFIVRV
jgi:hypothetical protein